MTTPEQLRPGPETPAEGAAVSGLAKTSTEGGVKGRGKGRGRGKPTVGEPTPPAERILTPSPAPVAVEPAADLERALASLDETPAAADDALAAPAAETPAVTPAEAATPTPVAGSPARPAAETALPIVPDEILEQLIKQAGKGRRSRARSKSPAPAPVTPAAVTEEPPVAGTTDEHPKDEHRETDPAAEAAAFLATLATPEETPPAEDSAADLARALASLDEAPAPAPVAEPAVVATDEPPAAETPAVTPTPEAAAPAAERKGGILDWAKGNLDKARRLVKAGPQAYSVPSAPAPEAAPTPVAEPAAGVTDEHPAETPEESAGEEHPEEATDTPAEEGSLLDRARSTLPRPVNPAEEANDEHPAETPRLDPALAAALREAMESDLAADKPEAPTPTVEPGPSVTPAIRPATPAERAEEARLIDKISHRLENLHVFGKPFPEFVFGKVGLGVVRTGAKALAHNIMIGSGAAGALAGSVAGTAVLGGFAGLVAGAAVEYVRQVDANLSKVVKEQNPDLTSRKAIFLAKLKETKHHREIFTEVNRGKLAKAAIIGAITGAGAGAIMQIPGVHEFIEDHIRLPNIQLPNLGVGDTVNSVTASAGQTINQVTGGAGQWAGEQFGSAGHWVSEAAGNVSHTANETTTHIAEWANIGGAGDAARAAAQHTQEVAHQAELAQFQTQYDDLQTKLDAANTNLTQLQNRLDAMSNSPTNLSPDAVRAAGWVPKAEYDTLHNQLDTANAKLAALQGAAHPTTPPVDQLPGAGAARAAATTAATTAGEHAVDQATALAQTHLDTAFSQLHLIDNYQLHSGDSVAGITEGLGKTLGLSNHEAWLLGQKLASENGIASDYYGTQGAILDRNLPVGKVMNMKGVKALALEMLKNKANK